MVQEAEQHRPAGRVVGAEQLGRKAGRELSEYRWPEQDSGQDLADDLGLTQLTEQLPEQIGRQQQHQDGQQDLPELRIRHRNLLLSWSGRRGYSNSCSSRRSA